MGLKEEPLEVARLGLRGGPRAPRRDNRNLLYRPPTEAGAAWMHLYGTCRALVEQSENGKAEPALAGRLEREDDQTANILAIRECAALLNALVKSIEQGRTKALSANDNEVAA